MKTIYKYSIDLEEILTFADPLHVRMPADSKFLSVGMQGSLLCLWALVNMDNPKVIRLIFIRGTGHQLGLAEGASHIGTVQEGPYVWHVFDGGEDSTGQLSEKV